MATEEQLRAEYEQEMKDRAEYEQYLAETGGGGEPGQIAAGPTIKNEMHPDMSYKSRLIYKMFSQNPEAGAKYLQKENPDFEWAQDPEGAPIAKKKGEEEWYRLDPTASKVTDYPSDIVESGYDLLSGLGQGVATTAAGLAGGVLGGGLGAIPSAMAASGLTAAGAEALRQKIGTMLGVGGEELDTGQIGLAGGVGAIIPLGFGTGAGAKQAAGMVARQAASKPGVLPTLKNAMQTARPFATQDMSAPIMLGEQLAETQSAPLRRYVAPMVGSIISGEKSDLINQAKKMLPILNKPGGSTTEIAEKSEAIRDFLVDAIKTSKGKLGEQIGEMHDVTAQGLRGGGEVSVLKIIDPLVTLKNSITEEGLDSPETRKLVSEIDSVIKSVFSKATKAEVKNPDPGYLQAVDKQLGLGDVVETEAFVTPNSIPLKAAWQAYHQLKGKLQSFGGNLDKSGTVGGVAEKADTVTDKRIIGAIGQMRENIKDDIAQKVFRAAADKEARYVLKMGYPNLPDAQIDEMLMKNNTVWKEPRVLSAGSKALDKYKELNSGFSEMSELASDMNNKTDDANKLLTWVNKAGTNPLVFEKMRGLSESMGVDLVDEAVKLKALRTFGEKTRGEKALEKDTSFQKFIHRTPLAGIAGYLGWMGARKAGGEIMESSAAAGAAAAGGYQASNPAMLRQYMNLGKYGQQALTEGPSIPDIYGLQWLGAKRAPVPLKYTPFTQMIIDKE